MALAEGEELTFLDIPLNKAYDSDTDDILMDFFVPILSEAVSYKRLAGFFSSGMLSVAARGVSRFVHHGGKMELVCGARLSSEDVEAIRKGYLEPSKVLEGSLMAQLPDIEDEFIRDHVAALGWMIANGNLSIKIALVLDEEGHPMDDARTSSTGIFHQKVGILQDGEGNRVSFSGSDNESASAWVSHIEEFKVFRGWIEGEKEYVAADVSKFDKFWEGKGRRTIVLSAPEAINRRLVDFAPKDMSELDLDKWQARWMKRRKGEPTLWRHQLEAVDAWFGNNCTGIMEMATGSGKTNVALECLKRLSRKERKLLTVITTPYGHLSKQWIKNAQSYCVCDEPLVADTSNPGWKDELADALLDMRNDVRSQLVLFTTHTTFGSDDFVHLVGSCDSPAFLIADEVHGIGAPERQRGLIPKYTCRLGLSATPKRWFDEEGTATIYEFFGPVVYEFSLYRGINEINESTERTYLVPYEYLPHFVELSEQEIEQYRSVTEKIVHRFFAIKDQVKREESLELLYFERARILDDAVAKYDELKRILDELGEVRHSLLYCSPKQLPLVQDILNERNIMQHKFTMEEGVLPSDQYGGKSEREYILDRFTEGRYQALVAMRCLDEGVDVPPAKTAILMASSSNPREFIQRRGRILRRHKDKDHATIYDIIVLPTISGRRADPADRDIEKKIMKTELDRFKEFANDAENSVDCLRVLNGIQHRFLGK